jgi:hypothetical protein
MSFIRSQAVSGGGFSFKYTFSDSTSSGPSAGQVRLNNNASASATQAFVSETDRNGKNMAALLDLVAANTGLLLTSEADPSRYAYYVVTGSTDNGGDRTLAVTHVASNSTLTGNVMISIAGGGGGGVGVQSVGDASPVGSVTPTATNSLYLQRTFAPFVPPAVAELYPEREVLWIATGTTSADWRVSMAAPIRRVSTENPNGSVIADMPGQLLVNYTEDTYSNTLTATVYISGSAEINGTNNKWYAI